MTLPCSHRVLTMLAVFVGLAFAGLAVVAQPSVAKTRACDEPRYPNKNPGGYFTSLKATNVSCRTARSVTLAHYRCRVKNGIKGKCRARRVKRYRCTESRPRDSQSQEQLNARVTCKRGTRKVVYTYQQNLR